MLRALAARIGGSYKVRRALFRLGFNDRDPSVRGLTDPLLYSSLEGLVPPRELWVNPNDELVHYFRWIWEYRSYLVLLCDLRPDSAVLDLGCHHGRLALGLLGYLRPPKGRYVGLDIQPRAIGWARDAITSRHPHFTFVCADVRNRHYNPQGAVPAESYRLPFDDASFDVVFAASLFTHLLPAAAANYLRECGRVLRVGGRALISVFLTERYGHGGPNAFHYYFEHAVPGVPGIAVHDPGDPEAIVSYSRDVIVASAAEAGLELEKVIPGHWPDIPEQTLNEQDLLILSRDR
jgi:SAM-dependent methyltransferase